MKQKEFILCAAIDYNGTIICGHRHGDCYKVLKDLLGEESFNNLPDRDHQGFLTSLNRYVGREEAWIIAKENNQIAYGLKASEAVDEELNKWLGLPEKYNEPILISENLY